MEHLISSQTKIIYFRGLAFDMTEKDVRYIFKDCGVITNLKLLYADTGRFKGAGYVVFESHEMAVKAAKMDDTTYRNKFVYVSLNSSSRIEDLFKHYEENPEESNENTTETIESAPTSKQIKYLPLTQILVDDEATNDAKSSSSMKTIKIPQSMLPSYIKQQNQEKEGKKHKHEHKKRQKLSERHSHHHHHKHESKPKHRRRERDPSHRSNLDSSSDDLYHAELPE